MKKKFQESKRRIYIELTNRCNLVCGFCPYPEVKDHRPDMELDLVKKIIDDIKRNIQYRIIYFHNLGEPLMYKNLEEVLNYCDGNNIKYGITTNGLLLDKNKSILKNKKIDQLNISYQATRKKLHDERKTMISVDEYRRLIVNDINALQLGGFSGTIKIKLLTTDHRSMFKDRNFENIESADELTTEIDKFYFDLMGRKLQDEQRKKITDLDICRHHKIKIKRNVFIETFPFLTWGNYKQQVWQANFGRCNAIKEQLVILSNGDVIPCCYDIDSEMFIGNTREQELSEILENDKSKELQNEFSSGIIRQKRCQKCLGSVKLKDYMSNQWSALLDKNDGDENDSIICL